MRMRKSSPSPQYNNLRNTLALCVALLSPLLLVEKTYAFFAPAPRGRAAAHLVQHEPHIGMVQQGTVMENSLENVVSTAEVWESFREEDHERFLSEFWQKKPLLIRNALPGFSTLLSKDELAGLACCPDVESRIVSGGRMVSEAGKDWRVEYGPFEEQTFSALEDTHWTLLVNEVNRHVPEVSDLLNKFRFVPTWRIDDVMISYAPEGGSVGPHVDSYDVFLLQAAGKRRWAIEGSQSSDEEERTRSVQDIDVRVLADFKESQAWILEPGDALYLPPRIAHYGMSLDEDCMTYSIGFRAPSARDLVTYFSDHVATTVTNADDFFTDPDLRKQENHGLISREAISRGKSMIREAVQSALDDDDAFDRWFGGFVTRSRRDHTGYPVPMDEVEGLSFGYQFPEDVTSAIRRAYRKENASITSRNNADGLGPFVYHAEGLTFAFVEHVGAQGGATIFVDGNAFPIPARSAFVAGLICQSPRLSSRDLGPALEGEHGADVEELLHLLLREGFLYPADD